MIDHKDYEILCALAATGQLTQDESLDFASHCASCAACRHRLTDMVGIGVHLLNENASVKSIRMPGDIEKRFVTRARWMGVPLGSTPAKRRTLFVTPANLLGVAVTAWILLVITLPTLRHPSFIENRSLTASTVVSEESTKGRRLLARVETSNQGIRPRVRPKLHPRGAGLPGTEPIITFPNTGPRFVFYRPSSIPHDYAAIPAPTVRPLGLSFVPPDMPASFQRFDLAIKPGETRIALLDHPQRFALGSPLSETQVRVPRPLLQLPYHP